MKSCGIIAEYNPFHNGHIHHIQETRRLGGFDCLIAVMSGNFTQRGEPAVIDKRLRAAAAVENGIDVVIELPYIYAVQAASGFAHGGITLLKTARVDAVSFGSECGNLENLQEIADTPVNPDHLRKAMDAGMSYPKAYSLLTSAMLPNDILAVAYLKELKGSGITPLLVQRTNGYHDETMSSLCSAAAIRKALSAGENIADATPMAELLEAGEPVFMDAYYPYLRTSLLLTPPERLRSYFLVSEGIENHLIRCASENADYASFLKAAVTYRYTSSRIRRTCLSVMAQITKEEVRRLTALDTLRVLAFNDTGRTWLRQARDKGIRVASRFTDVPYLYRSMEYRTTLLYTSAMAEEKRRTVLKREITGAEYIRQS